jgi:hypothetical protein
LGAWAADLKAIPGFALPYDLIPSKDREIPAAPHYSPNKPSLGVFAQLSLLVEDTFGNKL